MEFRLPQNLQVELLSYDPALKALARQNKPASAKTKPKYPLGKPENLIPTDIVRQSLLDDALTNINGNPANARFQAFKKIVAADDDGGCKSITHAIVYHYEQCWYAAWLPPANQQDDYVYGYTVTYKDTQTSWKMLPYSIKQNKDKYTQVTYGRSVYYTYTQLVTKQDICNGNDSRNWNLPLITSYHDKSRNLYPALRDFEDALKASIPTWNDSRNIFDRIKSKSLAYVLFDNRECNNTYWAITNKDTWTPSYESLIELITYHAHTTTNAGYEYNVYNKILHIIATPFFKKWIQSKCNECITASEDKANDQQLVIKQPWKLIHELFQRILYVNNIWPDCPIDYYQTHLDILLGIRSISKYNVEVITAIWLNTHMPVASFFSIMSKFYEEQVSKTDGLRRYNFDTSLNIYTTYFSHWSDTISMLTNILKKNITLAPPKRWRIDEFHDYVQAESWKLTNANESLPQDLFPTPIKVSLGSSNWSFFQPIDTHQLAQWGQAVRNCVGNATHYAEGVRKKKHFIVLAMVDNKPQFTIQLQVNMGLMSVNQIAGIANARINAETEELYKTSFAKALQLREEQLQS